MRVLIFIGAVFVTLVSLFILISKFNSSNNTHTVVIDEKKFTAEIAKSEEEQRIGLSKYNKISDDFAMVFPFTNEGYYTFWMKDMKFSIDIIYVRRGEIVDIFKNVPYPKSKEEKLTIYKPSTPSDTVVEINGGLSDRYNFKKGNGVLVNY